MKRFARTMFLIVFATAFSSCDFAQSGASTGTIGQNVAGKWSGSFDMTAPDGSVHHDTAVLNLKQDGSVVSGSIGESEDKQSPIKDGKDCSCTTQPTDIRSNLRSTFTAFTVSTQPILGRKEKLTATAKFVHVAEERR